MAHPPPAELLEQLGIHPSSPPNPRCGCPYESCDGYGPCSEITQASRTHGTPTGRDAAARPAAGERSSTSGGLDLPDHEEEAPA